MNEAADGLILSADMRPKEEFDDPGRGSAYWYTLFSGDRTPTRAMSAGVMVVPPSGRLEPHRHAHPEIYYVAAGMGVLTINGTERSISVGDAAFIPGNAVHALRNDGPVDVRVFYVFPADSFAEVIYHFE